VRACELTHAQTHTWRERERAIEGERERQRQREKKKERWINQGETAEKKETKIAQEREGARDTGRTKRTHIQHPPGLATESTSSAFDRTRPSLGPARPGWPCPRQPLYAGTGTRRRGCSAPANIEEETELERAREREKVRKI
jgi:hypothetical protein